MKASKNNSVKDSKPAKSFRDLVVWRKAHELVLAVYKLTEKFPKTENYGLISQIRRSASNTSILIHYYSHEIV